MGGYANFLKRMNAGGTSIRDELVENGRRQIEQTLPDDPSYLQDGCELWYSDRVLHPRIYEYTYRSSSPAQANIQTRVEEPFYLGDILHWQDPRWGDMGWWLCIDKHNLHGINLEGKLQFCNVHLKFYSSLDGTLREYPVSIINATQYGTGEKNNEFVKYGSASHILYIPCDEHTRLIDSGMRFLIDYNRKLPTCYRTTQDDTSSYSDGDEAGYLRITILEDVYNPKTDDAENMIADAWEDREADAEELKDDDNKDLWL